MKVTYFQRKVDAKKSTLSIERIFENLRSDLELNVTSNTKICKFYSQGLFKRIFNILEAPFYQGDVNHITGEIHYINLLMRKNKTILTIHDCVGVENSKGIKKLLMMYFWYILPVSRARIVTAISEKTKQDILKICNINPDDVFVIPNSLRDGFYYDKSLIKLNVTPSLLLVGTKKNKNLKNICLALSEVNTPYQLDIIGKLDDDSRTLLESYSINYRNSVSISDEELIRKYRSASVNLFVSTYEGFGMPIIESQSVGTPLITSNISPMKDICGDGACIVDPYSPDDIRRGILKILNDVEYRQFLIQKGLLNAGKYSSKNTSEQYLMLYKKITGGRIE